MKIIDDIFQKKYEHYRVQKKYKNKVKFAIGMLKRISDYEDLEKDSVVRSVSKDSTLCTTNIEYGIKFHIEDKNFWIGIRFVVEDRTMVMLNPEKTIEEELNNIMNSSIMKQLKLVAQAIQKNDFFKDFKEGDTIYGEDLMAMTKHYKNF